MEGEDYRATIQGNVSGMLNMAVSLHRDRSVEVQALVHQIRQLVTSLQAGNHDQLRDATYALVSIIAETQHKFWFDFTMYKTMLIARSFVVAALQLVDCDHPAIAAGQGVFVDLNGRPNMQQQQLEDSAASSRNPQLRRSMVGDRQLVYRPPPVTSTPLSNHDQQQHNTSSGGRSAIRRQNSKKRYSQAESYSDVEDEQPLVKKTKQKMEMCDYCEAPLPIEREHRLKHIGAVHKEHLYKYIDRSLMCKTGYCDYPASTERNLKIHVSKMHKDPTSQVDSAIELEKAGSCPYCKLKRLETMDDVREHVTLCEKRTQKPMIGCSACRMTFHFVHELVAHFRNKGHGMALARLL